MVGVVVPVYSEKRLTQKPLSLFLIPCNETLRVLDVPQLIKYRVYPFFVGIVKLITFLPSVRLTVPKEYHSNIVPKLGKGNKEREVYFSGKTAIHIKEYLKERKDITIDGMGIKYNKGTSLFVSTKYPYKHIQKTTVEQMIRNLGQASGVVRVHPHLFRATYATRLAQKGVSVNIIAKSLGHANLNTVERYALLDNMHIEQSIRCVGFN